MRIGLFSDTYYPQINGVATSTRILERELTRLGHTVFVFTTTSPDAKVPLPRVFRLPSLPFVFSPTHRMTLLYPPKLLLSIKKFKLDIVHTQTEFPLGIFGKGVSKACRIPHVHTYHTMYEDYVHYIARGHVVTPKMAQNYSRFYCNRADAIIAPAEKAKDSLIKYGVTKPIHVVPTGITFEPFAEDRYSSDEIRSARAALGIDPAAPVIVSVGRVAREKSIDIIIKAMPELIRRIPGVKFAVIGPGPMIDELKALAESLGVGDAVIFAGGRPWNEIGKYYRIGDVFASASVSETQGLTYCEAMASGLPVCAKKDDSIRYLIKDCETGYLFEKDSDAAGVLYEALTDKEKSGRIVRTALEMIETMSSEHFGKAAEGVYEQVIAERLAKRGIKKQPRIK